jgi:hypothetical protein
MKQCVDREDAPREDVLANLFDESRSSPAPAMRACSNSFFFLRWKASSSRASDDAVQLTHAGQNHRRARLQAMRRGVRESGISLL